MDKREYGWCQHVKVTGFYRPNGSTALKIENIEAAYVYWITEKMCHVCCGPCYRRLNPIEGPLASRLAVGIRQPL